MEQPVGNACISRILGQIKQHLLGCSFDGAMDPYAAEVIREVEQLLPVLLRCEEAQCARTSSEREAVFSLRILFAPTGPLQELSLDHRWGNALLSLAKEAEAWADQITA